MFILENLKEDSLKSFGPQVGLIPKKLKTSQKGISLGKFFLWTTQTIKQENLLFKAKESVLHTKHVYFSILHLTFKILLLKMLFDPVIFFPLQSRILLTPCQNYMNNRLRIYTHLWRNSGIKMQTCETRGLLAPIPCSTLGNVF